MTYILSQTVLRLYPFFFSSRRRHTRWPRDWSSDVCSSDLIKQRVPVVRWQLLFPDFYEFPELGMPPWRHDPRRSRSPQIGRASCRERVEIAGVEVTVNKKH